MYVAMRPRVAGFPGVCDPIEEEPMNYLMHHYNVLLLWHPEVLLLAVLLTILYWQVTGPLKERLGIAAMVVPAKRRVFWLLGMLAFYLAMGTPVALVADKYLYIFHMIQLSLLSMIVPPLVWSSMPEELVGVFIERPVIKPLVKFWGHPIAAMFIFNALNWFWQYPAVLDYSLRSSLVFTLGNYLMLVAAIFLWWPVAAPHRRPSVKKHSGFRDLIQPPWGASLSPEAQMLYLFFNMDMMMPAVILVADVTSPIYQFYIHAPHIFGTGALADQQLGALLMGVVMFVTYAIAFTANFRFYDLSSWYS